MNLENNESFVRDELKAINKIVLKITKKIEQLEEQINQSASFSEVLINIFPNVINVKLSECNPVDFMGIPSTL